MGHCNTIQAQYRDRNVERIQRQLKISEYMEMSTFVISCVSAGLHHHFYLGIKQLFSFVGDGGVFLK